MVAYQRKPVIYLCVISKIDNLKLQLYPPRRQWVKVSLCLNAIDDNNNAANTHIPQTYLDIRWPIVFKKLKIYTS